MTTNGDRAQCGRVTIEAYAVHLHPGDHGDLEDTVADLIADCLHYVREKKLDPNRVAKRALDMWRAEDLDPAGDGKRPLFPPHFKTQAVWYVLWIVTLVLMVDEIRERLAALIQ